MANMFDDVNGPVNPQGHDLNVVQSKQVVTVGTGSKVFEIFLWCMILIPGIVFAIKKVKARNYFNKLQQDIQTANSEIQNEQEQRFQILQNVVGLVQRSTDQDKDTFVGVAKARGGMADTPDGGTANTVETLQKKVNVALENYPDLKSQAMIMDAMQQNSYLQREITAQRTLANDKINQFNREIQIWPTNRIVAAKMELSNIIPYAADAETVANSRKAFF